MLHTLQGPARLQQEIRRSRFIALASPIGDPEQALAFIAEASDAQATHNCWAYRIGQQYRFSDDGEPGGTAGRPILQAIDGQGFDRVAVLVTRWYGGIKLGAGGLARAYGGSAAECLRLADRVAVVDQVDVQVFCDFAWLEVLRTRLGEYSAIQIAERFDAFGADLRLRLPRECVSALADLVRDLSRGQSRLRSD
ncbi:IMPACT family protein [Dokdonella immobilis]|uniref:Uncharacterized protein, YigZ family n=1 Tax=Dokdonella immobilis TaxID=578942 RepID=A0A1I4VWP7_9GAMM|nr:YigZ family protein [Dokdonella immobilis]SFN05663.1 uncharacterized protein, YigZ family [Dokdonella immobilis]